MSNGKHTASVNESWPSTQRCCGKSAALGQAGRWPSRRRNRHPYAECGAKTRDFSLHATCCLAHRGDIVGTAWLLCGSPIPVGRTHGDLWLISPCARGWRRGQSERRKVVSSLRLEGADLLATVAQKLASGHRGGEDARRSTAAFSADSLISCRSPRSSKFGGTGRSVLCWRAATVLRLGPCRFRGVVFSEKSSKRSVDCG
jgi:hypothetical protein